jgi:hypothetical protein
VIEVSTPIGDFYYEATGKIASLIKGNRERRFFNEYHMRSFC